MRKVFYIVFFLAICGFWAAVAIGSETHPLFSDVEVSDLSNLIPCSPGFVVGVGDADDLTDASSGSGSVAVLAICNGTGDGWLTIPIMSTHMRLDRIALPTCNSSLSDVLRVDADGDLCYCNGSSWEMLNTGLGGSCIVAVASHILREDGDFILREDGGKIVRE